MNGSVDLKLSFIASCDAGFSFTSPSQDSPPHSGGHTGGRGPGVRVLAACSANLHCKACPWITVFSFCSWKGKSKFAKKEEKRNSFGDFLFVFFFRHLHRVKHCLTRQSNLHAKIQPTKERARSLQDRYTQLLSSRATPGLGLCRAPLGSSFKMRKGNHSWPRNGAGVGSTDPTRPHQRSEHLCVTSEPAPLSAAPHPRIQLTVHLVAPRYECANISPRVREPTQSKPVLLKGQLHGIFKWSLKHPDTKYQ